VKSLQANLSFQIAETASAPVAQTKHVTGVRGDKRQDKSRRKRINENLAAADIKEQLAYG
jgi:hypothetical protein